MRLVDSHCHLDDEQFDTDRDSVVERARQAGLKYILSIGTGNGPPDLQAAVRMAEKYPFVLATVGVHPNDAGKIDSETFHHVQQLLTHSKIKAIGEIGLDYHWGVPKEKQVPVFVRQLEIAAVDRLPVVIHTRDAWTDTVEILRREWAPTGLGCVMHCFTGDREQADECLALGFFLSFGGVTTFPKAENVREAARITPSDRLLIETDAPYLAPVPQRGKRNEPAFVVHTARAVAEARGISVEEICMTTTRNFERLFAIEPADDFEAAQLH